MSPQVVYFGIEETLVLSKQGVWLSNEQEITHAATVQAFFRFLHCDESGQWWIQIGREKKPVTVEDTPAFVRSIHGTPERGYRIGIVSQEALEDLKIKTLRYQPGRLTCRTAMGREARFLQGPYHELLKTIGHDKQGYYLEIQGARIDLSADLAP